jgi:hypothetical protein
LDHILVLWYVRWLLHVIILGEVNDCKWLVVDRHNHVPKSTNVSDLLLAPAVPVVDQVGVYACEQMVVADIGRRENCTSGRAEKPLK